MNTESFIPTASSTNIPWISIGGLLFVVLILIPNIVYALKYPDNKNRCTNRRMNCLEQIGRYASMLLMVTGLGFSDLSFPSLAACLAYLIGNSLLVLAYWIAWIPFFRIRRKWNAIVLALLPGLVFLLSSICLSHPFLTAAAIIFTVSHIYVTVHNF